MMWSAKSFIMNYKKNRAILMAEWFYPVNKFSGIIVKDKIDLEIVSKILKISKNNSIKYLNKLFKFKKILKIIRTSNLEDRSYFNLRLDRMKNFFFNNIYKKI